MTQSVDNQRFKKMFTFLREHKLVRNQQDFTERIGSDKSTISQIMNNRLAIPNHLFANVNKAFPFIDDEWLRSGKGEMLKPNYTQHIYGGERITQTGNITDGDSPALVAALAEMSEQRKMFASELESRQREMDRLLSMHERLLSLLESERMDKRDE